MSNKTVFVNPSDLYLFDELTNVNIIVLNTFDYISANLVTHLNLIKIMIQGNKLPYEPIANIDNMSSIGSFSIDTHNRFVLVVDKSVVTTIEQAYRYIMGVVVKYPMKNLTYADTTPTYTVKSYDTNNYLVSETIAADMPSVMNKIKCLDNILDINEKGYYYHVVTRSMK